MNVSLTPELERFIADLVETGRYRSASEVVREAVRRLQDRQAEREAKLAALRAAMDVGIAELDSGEELPADEVFEEVLRSLGDSEAA